MARQRFSPQHSLVGRHVFVSPNDSAWRTDDIDTECESIRKAAGWTPPSDPREQLRTDPARAKDGGHVFWRYFHGLTRFDIEEPALAKFLDRNKRPECWRIRPLTMQERHVVIGFEDAGDNERAYTAAFLAACEGIESPADDAARELSDLLEQRKGKRTPGMPTDESVLQAVAKIAYEIPFEVGSAIVRLSQDLTAEEKKPSAGLPGETSAAETASPAT